MNKKLIRCGLFALALTVALPAAPAPAQEFNSMYIAPKVVFSRKTGDMSNAKWINSSGWSKGVLGGSDHDNGFGFGLAVGNDFSLYSGYPIRMEFEYVYHGEGKFDSGNSVIYNNTATHIASQSFDIKAHTFMINGFYDIDLGAIVTPYVGGGLGLAYLSSDYSSKSHRSDQDTVHVKTSNNDWSFAWNLGAGASFAIDDQVALDVGYRYYDMGDAEPGMINASGYRGSPKVDLTSHELSVGLRFSIF